MAPSSSSKPALGSGLIDLMEDIEEGKWWKGVGGNHINEIITVTHVTHFLFFFKEEGFCLDLQSRGEKVYEQLEKPQEANL